MNREIFAKNLAKEYRTYGYDNPKDWKEILRNLRKEMPEVKGKIKAKKLPEFLTLEEARLLIKTALIMQTERNNNNKGLLTQFFLVTGLRNAECCKIRVENIDFTTGVFKVVSGKGSKDRFGLIPENMLRSLITYLNGRQSGFLFLNNRGKPYSTRSIQYIIKDVVKRAGLTKAIHPHSLRHTLATILIESGIPIEKIQKILGHEDIKTTTIYAHLSLENMKQEILQITNKI